MNDQVSITLDKNSHSVAIEVGKSENSAFGQKDGRNYIAEVGQFRLRIGDADVLCNYFVRMQRRNSNFFYVIGMDEEGQLQNVFWADARSRAAYESFGDVLFFDILLMSMICHLLLLLELTTMVSLFYSDVVCYQERM